MTRDAPARSKVLLTVAAVVFVAAAIAAERRGLGWQASQTVANAAFVGVGALIVVRRPGTVVGALLISIGVGWEIIHAADAVILSLVEMGELTAARWLALVFASIVPMAIWLFVPLLLVFPDGHAKARGAKPFLWGSAAYAAIAVGASLLSLPTVPGQPRVPHPFVNEKLATSIRASASVLIVGLMIVMVAAAGMLIARARKADATERRQIAWFAYAAASYFLIAIFNFVVDPLKAVEGGFLLVDAIGFTLIPTGIGIAIMRYRLYDIDRIFNRSITYGLLAMFIGAVYVGVVAGVGALIGGEGGGLGLSIGATALVAIAFHPARNLVQRWANRLVYGPRATPYEVLSQFSRRSVELSDEELIDRIPQLIAEGTQAAEVALWIHTDSWFSTASTWPRSDVTRHLNLGGSFLDPDGDYSVPVFHDGELLGGISLVMERGDALTSVEQDLVDDLAGGMGLALRNARLTATLRDQVAQLEASRERVLAAADAARRALERDLDSGPQQQLVALKVKLGPTRKLAELAGAERTAEILQQLETDAGAAIRAVRDFAGGIYPPLLEAEGLVVAIKHHAQQAAMPVSVAGDGVGRFSRDVEAAIYFAVLEALQNTAKYAGAKAVSVALTYTGTNLAFEVRDDGAGFDVATADRGAGLDGMADRLDTVGGSVEIDSRPGHGTIVSGSIPLANVVSAGR